VRSINKAKILETRDIKPGQILPIRETDGLDEGRAAVEAALDKKALEPVLMDVRGMCSYTNYMLVVSGRSDRQVEAIADGILDGLRERGVRALGVEGKGSGQWVLVDFGDMIAHVFHHPAREHYDIESLWIDAPRVALDVPAEARLSAEDSY
jgi:ribosome-associated protein